MVRSPNRPLSAVASRSISSSKAAAAANAKLGPAASPLDVIWKLAGSQGKAAPRPVLGPRRGQNATGYPASLSLWRFVRKHRALQGLSVIAKNFLHDGGGSAIGLGLRLSLSLGLQLPLDDRFELILAGRLILG